MTNNRSFNIRLLLGTMIAVFLATLAAYQPARAAGTCTVRLYLSPVIGSGTEEDSIRPLIGDLPSWPHKRFLTYGEYFYGAFDLSTGRPVNSWALVSGASENHQPLIHNKDLGALPDLPWSTPISSIDEKTMAELQDIFERFDLDPTILDTANTYQDVLNFIAQTLAGEGNPYWIPNTQCTLS